MMIHDELCEIDLGVPGCSCVERDRSPETVIELATCSMTGDELNDLEILLGMVAWLALAYMDRQPSTPELDRIRADIESVPGRVRKLTGTHAFRLLLAQAIPLVELVEPCDGRAPNALDPRIWLDRVRALGIKAEKSSPASPSKVL